MTARNPDMPSTWVDPDDAPELTDAMLNRAVLRDGDTIIPRRPGRPKADAPKEQVTLRLDRDVVAGFRAGGPGWQTRLNAVLREHLERKADTTA